MTTFVGMQEDFIEAVKELVELDYDAVEAYEAAIARLENNEYKIKLREFKNDHENHIEKLESFLIAHGHEVPQGPDSKQYLTKGKVIIANLFGDKAILQAMLDNEVDTNIAYARMEEREDQLPDIIEIIVSGFEDEVAHKTWLQQTIKSIE